MPSLDEPPEPGFMDFLPVSIGAACVGMTVMMRSSPDSVTVEAKAEGAASEVVVDGAEVVDGADGLVFDYIHVSCELNTWIFLVDGC